jgi:hypothetical protein
VKNTVTLLAAVDEVVLGAHGSVYNGGCSAENESGRITSELLTIRK